MKSARTLGPNNHRGTGNQDGPSRRLTTAPERPDQDASKERPAIEPAEGCNHHRQQHGNQDALVVHMR
jgi:hypothetical protein